MWISQVLEGQRGRKFVLGFTEGPQPGTVLVALQRGEHFQPHRLDQRLNVATGVFLRASFSELLGALNKGEGYNDR